MPTAVLVGVGLALTLLQSNLFRLVGWIHVPGLVPSLVLPLVVYMGVSEFGLARGAAIAFVFGYATDLIGIAPIGLYTFTYVALFVLARAAGSRFAAQTALMQLVLGLGFAFVQSLMVLVLLAIFGREPYVPRALYPLALPHVLATGVVSPPLFRLARRIQMVRS
ncbi:MAG TPA: rod shape-determining protein MreD [Polyangiaceae bacterium]|jgi:rod shape-determining protein MreD